jgi:hypothetical protein
MNGLLPPPPKGFTYRLGLARAATPRLLKQRPIHRWFYFPHSYSPELVEAILDTWDNGLGLDLLPLAVLVSNVKVANHDPQAIQTALYTVLDTVQSSRECPEEIPTRLARALTEAEYTLFWRLRRAILRFDEPVREFMLVGLVNILPQFSRAVADGGWFRWVEKPERADLIIPAFRSRVQEMLDESMTHGAFTCLNVHLMGLSPHPRIPIDTITLVCFR